MKLIVTEHSCATGSSKKTDLMPAAPDLQRFNQQMTKQIDTLHELGSGFCRPECVLAHSSGLIMASDWSGPGGIRILDGQGRSTSILGSNTQNPLKPNGIALEPNGEFLFAHLGDKDGGVFHMRSDGTITPLVTHANNKPLPPTNYIVRDAEQRLWITVSTTVMPRADDYRKNAKTGFIAVAEPGQSNARIVADGLGYTNECVIDHKQQCLFVNETFARRLLRFDLADDGTLSNRTVLTTFTDGTYPDGLCLDASGNLWVTSIVSNRIIRVTRQGEQELMFENSDAAHIGEAEAAYRSDTMSSQHLGSVGKAKIKNMSSMAFGGSDLTTMYFGNLLGDALYHCASDVTGHPLPHWNLPLGALENLVI